MITLTNLAGLSRGNYDKRYAIVRKLSRPIAGVEQISDLSPSEPLFWDYRKLVNQGTWNKDTFNSMYLPRFLQEMTGGPAKKSLNRLWKEDTAGLNIAIACFCGEEEMCHRSIVGGILKGVGCNIRTKYGDGSEYLKYFEMYQKLTQVKIPPKARSLTPDNPHAHFQVQIPAPTQTPNPNDPYAHLQVQMPAPAQTPAATPGADPYAHLRPIIQQTGTTPTKDPRFYQAGHVSAPGYQPQTAPKTYNNQVGDMRINDGGASPNQSEQTY